MHVFLPHCHHPQTRSPILPRPTKKKEPPARAECAGYGVCCTQRSWDFENIRNKQFKFEALDTNQTVYTDSDCAGCRSSRKSTSGGVTSTSVGVELCAMNKGAAEAIGITSSAADVGITFYFVPRKDASAALGVVNWDGVGKTRHINTADRCAIENWRYRRSSARIRLRTCSRRT